MSRKPSFANLRTTAQTPAPPSLRTPRAAGKGEGEGFTPAGQAADAPVAKPVSRAGRKQIAGFFTPEMSFAMHTLARRQGRSLQALMAEAFNDVLRKHGESPVGE